MGAKADKTFNFLGTGKEKTKDIAKRSMKIAATGAYFAIAGLGLAAGMTYMK